MAIVTGNDPGTFEAAALPAAVPLTEQLKEAKTTSTFQVT
jgi:hypothetical protein